MRVAHIFEIRTVFLCHAPEKSDFPVERKPGQVRYVSYSLLCILRWLSQKELLPKCVNPLTTEPEISRAGVYGKCML